MRIRLTSEEKDQMILRLIRRRNGRWIIDTHEGHIVRMAAATQPRTVEQVIEDEGLLTDRNTMLES